MATDNFNRANGALGANWANHQLDGSNTSLAISANKIIGTDAGNAANGNYWLADTFSSNHYSEITVPSTALTTWIGASVRAKADGSCYMGIYFNNAGTRVLQLFSRSGQTAFVSLGAAVTVGTLAAGTKLRLMVVGNMLSFLVDGVEKTSAYSAVVPSGGAPGIGIAGSADFLDDWSGANASYELHLVATDGNGVESYTQISQYNSGGVHKARVKRPTSPVGGKARNFLYVLPVSPEADFTYGDPTEYLRGLNVHNNYNVTMIEPSFHIDPWYGNHATNADRQFESFFLNELKPWVIANLSTTGSEKHWVIGFSKSGFGPMSIWFRNPTLWHVGAFWDFPGQGFTVYNQFSGSSDANYGTDANFQTNYRMTDAFLDSYKVPFQSQKRLWISGYNAFQADVDGMDAKWTTKGILHTYGTPASIPHLWTSGWVSAALTALDQMSVSLSSVTSPVRENAINAQANGPNAIDLAWAPTGATNYIIERKSTP